MRFLVPFIVLLALLPTTPSYADGSVTASVTAVKLYKGTAILVSSDPAAATYRANFTPEACMAELHTRWQAEATTRTSGSATYKCQTEERRTVTFTRPPPVVACPTPPPTQTRPGTCPTGTQGSWEQIGTTTYGPAPACAPTVTWRPVAAPEGICVPIPPPVLPAPAGLTATAESTSVIRLNWNVVPDAVAYSLRRCIGASCTSFSQLLCIPALTARHSTLGAGVTVRYQVAASRSATCAELGTISGIVNGTTLTVPNPPDPVPSACAGRVCTMNWTPGAPVATSPVTAFRVVYGRNSEQMWRAVQVNDPNARSAPVPIDASGEWHFATIAVSNGTDSVMSNVLTITVP